MHQVRPAKSAEAMVMETQRFSSAISTAIISARSSASGSYAASIAVLGELVGLLRRSP